MTSNAQVPPAPPSPSPSASHDTNTSAGSRGYDDLDLNEVENHRFRLRGQKLSYAISFVAGTGFTLFGYDQGVMSSLLTLPAFEAVFPQTVGEEGNAPTLQSLLVAIYEVGCLIGALSNLWIGDKMGRRMTMVLGGVIMIIGAILQATAFTYSHMIVARVVTGVGNGLNTSTVPSYQAECSAPEKRGKLVMVEGALITFGIMISYWIDFAFFWIKGSSSASWRAPIALQIIFPLIMIALIPFLPESPRWLVARGRNAEALAVIAALDDRPQGIYDHGTHQTYHAIREAVLMEGVDIELQHKIKAGTADMEEVEQAKARQAEQSMWKLLTSNGRSQNFQRTALAVTAQCFQQITGVNLIIYYATLLFERLGLDDVKSRILAACNGTEYFLAALVAVYLIEGAGRRKMMLIGGVGMCISMIVLCVLGYAGDRGNSGAQIGSAVFLFVYNTFFALGFLGMTWLYAAEVVGLQIRTSANALSTASNWTFNFVVVMVTGPSFKNIGPATYAVFAGLNAFIVICVFFFFPETGGRGGKARSLEDLDVMFAYAYNEGLNTVKVSLRDDIPAAGTPEADEILGLSSGVRHRGENMTERRSVRRENYGSKREEAGVMA